jgi:hypothetical protein
VFTARYGQSSYIKQIPFILKGLSGRFDLFNFKMSVTVTSDIADQNLGIICKGFASYLCVLIAKESLSIVA